MCTRKGTHSWNKSFSIFKHFVFNCSHHSSSFSSHINMNAYLISLAIIISIIGSSYCHDEVVFTEHGCNFTAHPKMGCKDDLHSYCEQRRCRCKQDYPVLLLGTFCVKKACKGDNYYDEFQEKCVSQNRATPSSKGSSCRFDYQCKGTHVSCLRQGYNRNCVCDPGFIYEEISGVCKQQYGLGGYCLDDKDCDLNVQRKLYCQFDKNDEKAREGTCQCIPDHRYNYEIDGCESMEVIHKRRWQMRGLILLMVATGIVFGLAMTCNMGLFGGSSFSNEMMLKRIVEERQRHEADLEAQKKKLTTADDKIDGGVEEEEEAQAVHTPINKTSTPKTTGKDIPIPPDDAIIAIDDQKPLEASSRRMVKTANGVKLMQF